MGKKRRLRSSQAKFGSKHSAHPRMVFLNSQTETVAEVTPSAPVVELAAKVEPEPEVVATPVEPVVAAVEEVAAKPVATKPKAKAATTKKRTTTTKKRTTTTRTSRKSRTKKKTSTEASA